MSGAKPPLMYAEHLVAGGRQMLRHACKVKLEAVVSKITPGKYQFVGPGTAKVTCRKRETFHDAGIVYKGNKFDGIYLGREEEGALTYAGKVEHGSAPISSVTANGGRKRF
jgi:bifunctional non-homologous end joining protein LigD